MIMEKLIDYKLYLVDLDIDVSDLRIFLFDLLFYRIDFRSDDPWYSSRIIYAEF